MDEATAKGQLVWGNNPHQHDLDAAIQIIINNAVPWLDLMLTDNMMLQLERQNNGDHR